MKINKRVRHEMRKRLDDQLERWKRIGFFYRPREGWLKSIRESLGMSARQLGLRLGKSSPDILAIEKREGQGRITLDTLQKVATALDCQLVYALVPYANSLEHRLEAEANKTAEQIVEKTHMSMKLEDQATSKQIVEEQVKDLTHELKHKLDPRIWNEK